jgi:hypothetical protein
MRATAASYLGAFVATVSGLTLQDWGVLVGIFTALGTFAAHLYFQREKLKTYRRVAAAQEAEALSHTGGNNADTR